MKEAHEAPHRNGPKRFRAHFAVLYLILVTTACENSEPPPPPPPQIRTVEVIQRDQPILIDMVGETRGSADIPIRARVEGVLLGMHFSEGRRVKKGDPLYTIDPMPFESQVVEAEGLLAESRTMLAKAKADLGRIRPLAEMGAVSQVDLDGAVAQFEAAQGSVQAAEARRELARIERSYTEIMSPIEGRIGISAARVGEFVGKSPNPVVLNFVSRTDPIRVRFSIDERRYLVLARRIAERGENAEPRGDSWPGLELILADGTVHEHRGDTVATAAAIDPETGTFTMEADFPNPESLVLAGQFARVRAVAEVRKDALLVPQRSVSELQGLFRVYVVGEDGTVELRNVELGAKIDRLQIVETGLKADERVALDVMRLRPGMKVVADLTELDDSGAIVEQADAVSPIPDTAGS
jgi:membrane fusion protein (multidrug efflux system)